MGHAVDGNVDVLYPEPGMMHVTASLCGTDGWGWVWKWEWFGRETSIPEISKDPNITGVVNWLTAQDLRWQRNQEHKHDQEDMIEKDGGDQ